jgi:hypothetical protein
MMLIPLLELMLRPGRSWWALRTQARYTRLSEEARDSLSVARLMLELLHEIPPSLLDETPTVVLMSHHMDLPARTITSAIDQLSSAISMVHAATQGSTKEKSYISLTLEPHSAPLEQFFRNRDDAYVPVAESFQRLHERLVLLAATILGDDTSEPHLNVYQQRKIYPLLDIYRTWLLKLNALRPVLSARPF